MRMRVLVVTNMYPCAESGHLGVFVRDHVEALRSLGLDVEVVFTNPLRSRFEYFTRLGGLRQALRAFDPDVVNAHHSYSVLQVLTASPRRKSRPPVVFTCHEAEALNTDTTQKDRGLTKKLTYASSIKRAAMGAADRVVAVNSRLPAAVGFDGAFDVIPPGIDLDRFVPRPRAEARRALQLDPDERIVFFPGDPRRSFHKGFDLFEASMALVGQDVRVITGGRIPTDEMPLHMAAADVVVQTSRFEASPMVVKEAMACNRPVVSTDVGDVQPLFEGLAGHFLCRSDAGAVARGIEEALSFGDETSGRARIESLGLGLDDIAARYVAVFSDVSSGGHAGSAPRGASAETR